MMDWEKLLSADRLGKTNTPDPYRSEFERDRDRIVFSAAFRRLQDKTQVHAFPESDYIRRRLTHSIEVGSVGRSLGRAAGKWLYKEGFLTTDRSYDVGQIVENACLAHDIGNPPFGHAGESAIGFWFKDNMPDAFAKALDEKQKKDLELFEGNAQGLRLLTRLQMKRNQGGLQLTGATLASFMKYPTASINVKSGYIGAKKHGYFQDDESEFNRIADAVGLDIYPMGRKRHPLVFLVEAADDICYRIIDVEDACKLGRISEETAKELLQDLAETGSTSDEIEHLRAKAIGSLVLKTTKAFLDNMKSISSGEFKEGLLETTSSHDAILKAKHEIEKRVFTWERTLSAEVAGATMISETLGALVGAMENPESYRNSLLLKLVPFYEKDDSVYHRLLSITDFVSGMTDSYLYRIHKRLTGQSIN